MYVFRLYRRSYTCKNKTNFTEIDLSRRKTNLNRIMRSALANGLSSSNAHCLPTDKYLSTYQMLWVFRIRLEAGSKNKPFVEFRVCRTKRARLSEERAFLLPISRNINDTIRCGCMYVHMQMYKVIRRSCDS